MPAFMYKKYAKKCVKSFVLLNKIYLFFEKHFKLNRFNRCITPEYDQK